MVDNLHSLLIKHFREHRNVVLVIDEAQNLPYASLEGIRVLSNLETEKEKLIQVIFCGQPEFDERLSHANLRQLQQRIAVRVKLRPLSRADTKNYIRHRLTVAGAEPNLVFTEAAITKIAKAAGGIPRVINTLCDNALITASGYRERPITRRVAKEVISDYRTTAKKGVGHLRFGFVGAASGVLGVAAALALVISLGPQPLTALDDTDALIKPARNDFHLNRNVATESLEVGHPIAQEPPVESLRIPTIDPPPQPERSSNDDAEQTSAPRARPAAGLETLPKQNLSNTADSGLGEGGVHQPVVHVVRPGDRLLDLVERIYGTRDDRLTQFVAEHNKQITSRNLIHVGDRLVFPALKDESSNDVATTIER
jgi:general secretion pathway protein A